jgi:DNA-binding response OmpR family regulator
LIIDDEASVRETVGLFLQRHGFEVSLADDGRSGVLRAAQEAPELVVCDLVMPGMDGYEVLAALRRDPRLADVAVIFLTGQSDPAHMRQGMNLGADDFLAKGGDLTEILNAVNARLLRRQADKQRQAEQMERALQLFAGIVHDLRDPLSVIFGYADLLKNTVVDAGVAGDKPKGMLDRMQEAMTRMQAILAETLLMARSRMRQLPFDPGPFDLRYLCRQIIADLDQGERVVFQCAAKHCPVVADALRVRQAIESVFSNALRYSKAPVIARLTATLGRYRLEVEDAGIGIPADEKSSIFEPFFRASNSLSLTGNGLNLSIAKSCLEQHGGAITFSSEANEGATFILDLPAAPLRPARALGSEGAEPSDQFPLRSATMAPVGAVGGSPQPSPPSVGTTASPAGRRIDAASTDAVSPELRAILVDDDPLLRGVLRDLFERSDSLVIVGEAESLGQARLLLGSAPAEVIFLDVNLPDGSGFELLPLLKPDTSVVFVTSAEEHAVQAFDCEAVDYLLKPVTAGRLRKALRRVRQRIRERSAPSAARTARKLDSFLVKTLTDQKVVKVDQIKRVLAYGEYSWVYWQNENKGALLRKSLKQWLRELPADRFIRVHRGAIVNLGYLERVEKLPGGRMQIRLLDTPEPIQVSLRLGPQLNRKLKRLPDPEPASDPAPIVPS